jgi:hypothetical protein
MKLAVLVVALAPMSAVADTASPQPAASAHAAVSPQPGHPLYFIVNIKPHMTQTQPWTGDLTLKINPEGIINGTYRSTSTKPDPFHGKIITVSGGLNGKNIHLDFGAKGYFPVKGEYHPGAGIVGTAYSKAGTTSSTGMPSLTRAPYNPRTTSMSRMTMPSSATGGTNQYDFVAKEEAKPPA